MGAGILLLILVGLYLLPTFVAAGRSHRQISAIFVLNLLLGWTMVGWVAALVWSLAEPAVVAVGFPNGAAQPAPAELQPCPFCAEPIRKEAVLCRYCGRDVAPPPKPPTLAATAPIERGEPEAPLFPPARPRRRRVDPLPWVIGAIVVLAIALFGLIAAMNVGRQPGGTMPSTPTPSTSMPPPKPRPHHHRRRRHGEATDAQENLPAAFGWRPSNLDGEPPE